MIRIATVLWCIAALSTIAIAADISETFPPPDDQRKPDRTIPSDGGGAVNVIAYSNDGRLVAYADETGTIRVRDARPGERNVAALTATMSGHLGRVVALAFTADNKSLISIASDGAIKTWDAATGNVLREAAAKLQPQVHRAAIRPTTRPVIAIGDANGVRLCDAQSGDVVRVLQPQDGGVRVIAFAPGGNVIAAANEGGGVRLWNTESGELTRTIQGAGGAGVLSLAASATHLVTGDSDGVAKLWSLANVDAPPVIIKARGGAIQAIAFAPRDGQFATANATGGVKVWDVATASLLCTQRGHDGPVWSVAFSSNGQKMASAGADGTVRYWTVPLPPIAPADLENIRAALPTAATVKPKQPRRLLVFWRADAILHKGGVPAANHAIEMLGKSTGAFEADFSRDYDVFDPAVLARYDAIVMNSTAHIAMPTDAHKRAYLDFVNGGKGVIGIHAAIDCFKTWPEGAAVVGATFGGHPWGPAGTWNVKLDEPSHPLLAAWGGKNFTMTDEFYEMGEPYTRADRRVLMTLDFADPATAGVKPLFRKDGDFAVSWIKRHGAGRVFYCCFGHRGEPFQRADVLRYYLDGIQYALGDLQVDDSPGPR